ncbi:peptide deformylase [Rhodovulum adriaticum]|uniref:Peptide deformylase n=1 Tax=Rhodovulum adriaticum TaxID=35804 RepID=A0A4R2NYX0_RHOAD|nr:peptide deformylase [Rhodovulum adriaticum]MBK1634969.1 peptide deformylase [Rhodovulum adriaticum]TCP27440.1 peptide deformylase [Rhodovulum adriaticum]
MSTRPILIHPDPRLNTAADPVAEIGDEMQRLAEDMLETMYRAPGIGLAAPQIGILQRLIVLDCAKDEGSPPSPITMFNPQVVWQSDDLNIHEEGCLSIPETFAEVTRPAEVVVQWTDPSGDPKEDRFSGLWATCVQHEIDHLNGKLFIDYLKPLKRQLITRKMKKLKRERSRAAG